MAQLRESVAATVAALKGISGVVHQTPSGELADVVGELDQLRALAEAGLIVAAAEAEQRGVIEQSQCASTAGWVRDCAWHLQTGGSAVVAKCVAILLRRPDLGVLADAVRSTDVTPAVAVTIAAEFDKIAPELADGAGDAVLDLMIGVGAEQGSGTVRELRELLLTRYGRDGAFQDEQDSRRRFVNLSPAREDAGIFRYELTVDAEGRAVLEAAIGPLSAPAPGPDGEHDVRPVGRRRGEALIQVCRRATAAGGLVPAATKAAVYVTMTLQDLKNTSGAGCILGSVDSGALLGPETVRKLACDAGIIPVVLGGPSEILDVGRTQRLFTAGQVKALWLRDKQCTFPRCEAPSHWCDAHHLKHWVDGGPTDLGNAALLCGRHHTIVHRDQLAAAIIDGQVLWDRKPGSNQRQSTAAA
jgi:hypothetical protein